MRRTKLWLLFLFAGIGLLVSLAVAQKKFGHPISSQYRDNNCVRCHSELREPVRISAHFFEWKGSTHEKNGVGCEKCHGGDPKAKTLPAAHIGVLQSSYQQSTLNSQNLDATCQSCHQEFVRAFSFSRHAKALKNSEMAANCTTCHQHMATGVITWPPNTSALCAKCHNPNGTANEHLHVAEQASDTIAAFTRAEGVIEWANYLIDEGRKSRLNFKAEEEKIKQFQATLKQAKVDWHEFNLNESRKEADEVFIKTTEVKDRIWKRLP